MNEHTAESVGLPDPAEMMACLFPRRRARLVVEVDLDPVPGWGNLPDDWQRMLQHYLDSTVGHYNPTVELVVTRPAQTGGDA